MKLSVITVNLNDKAGLGETLKSLASQTYKDFELIVIDGGSTDGSIDMIHQYGSQISYWVSEKDKGTYHAMNKGIKASKGNYCFFLNSGDSLVGPQVFENLFKANLWADVVSGNVLKIRTNKKYRKIVPHEKPTLLKLCIHSLPHQASLIKKQLFDDIGFYNESYKIVSDFDFFLKALVINHKSYQKVDIDFSFFNLSGISSNPKYFPLAREESFRCLQNNFPDMVDDLMDYRYFYTSNIGQMIQLLKKHKNLYQRIDTILGGMIRLKKMIVGK
jgi:glycosyltransferase involved in cell wall biosynthesis